MRNAYLGANALGDHVQTAIGLNTGDNSRFLRVWTEVSFHNIDFHCPSIHECSQRGRKWFPYNKGGTTSMVRQPRICRQLGTRWRETASRRDGEAKVAATNIDYYFKQAILGRH